MLGNENQSEEGDEEIIRRMTVASGFTDNDDEIMKRGSTRSMMTGGSEVVRQVEDDSETGT
jgi:hypothetical protein